MIQKYTKMSQREILLVETKINSVNIHSSTSKYISAPIYIIYKNYSIFLIRFAGIHKFIRQTQETYMIVY